MRILNKSHPSPVFFCKQNKPIGQVDFGENYVQELLDKAKVLPDSIRRFATTSDPIDCCDVHLYGHGNDPILTHLFQMGWLKPPTRKLLENFDSHHCQPWFSLVCAMFQNSEMMECFHSFCFFCDTFVRMLHSVMQDSNQVAFHRPTAIQQGGYNS